jgi:hypothetical protein
MFCQTGFDQWLRTLMQHLPHRSKPQAPVLALWSFGRVLARSCALSAVSRLLAEGMQRSEQTGRQRLRAWYDDVPRKRGATRQALHVEPCFPVLLGGGVRWGQGPQLALAIEATALGARCVVLAVSGVSRGCAIPVAWVVLPANTTQAWRREWRRRRRRRRPAVPRHGTVIVLADRGLDAPWLLRRMVRLGWHPLLRITTGGSLRPTGATCWRPLATLAPGPGTRWRGTGIAFARHQVPCPLLARWEAGDKDPWLILTDLAPEARDAGWYGLRAWIAQGLKSTKRAGWQWHRTRMSAPARAARLWLAVAVATVWRLRVGGEADATMPASPLLDVTGWCPERPRTRRATRLRLVSVFRPGWVRRLVARLRQEPLPQGRLVPEPWPAVPPLAGDPYALEVVLPEAA